MCTHCHTGSHKLSLSLPAHTLPTQTCKDAGFCRRNRGVFVNSYRIEASSVRAAGPAVTGVLVNEQAGKAFTWSLVAHNGGQFARLQVDESPGSGRYQITDLLEAGGLSQTADWVQQRGDAKGSMFACGPLAVELTYQPFRLSVTIDGKPAVNLNSRGMFQMEHRRTREVRACGVRVR